MDVLWPIERRILGRAFARHARIGTRKPARSIPTEGAESVAMSLAGLLGRTWGLLFFDGGATIQLAGGSPFTDTASQVLLLSCGSLFVVGFVRLAAAYRARSRFRRASVRTGAPSPPTAGRR